MKRLKLVGLAAIAALALTAMLGAGSASAAQTVLCETNEIVPYCPPEEFSQFDQLTASSTQAVFSLTYNGGTTKLTCTSSSLEGGTMAQAGEPLLVSMTSWSLGGCKLANLFSCTATTLNIAGFYDGSLAWSGGDDGALSITNGGEGNPGWHVVCGTEKVILDCSYTFQPTLDFEGGNPASVNASAEPMSQSGSACVGTNPTFTGKYTASSPAPGYLTQAFGQPEAVKTGLCSSKESPCPAGSTYSKGTELKAQSSDLTIDFDYESATTKPPIGCKSSVIAGSISATSGAPLPFEVTSWSFSECKTAAPYNRTCTLEATGLPYAGSLTAFSGSGNGFLGLAGPEWRAECNPIYFPLNCSYKVGPKTMPAYFHGGPLGVASITFKHVPVEELKGGNCLGSNFSISGTFAVTNHTAYVEEAK